MVSIMENMASVVVIEISKIGGSIMVETKRITLKNGVKLYPFSSFDELISFANEQKKILVAINAEKILHATEQTKEIIDQNIGYCDGTGAVMALKHYGQKGVKISGCELWLKIIAAKKDDSSFYLIGSKQDVIDNTITKLKKEFPNINIVGYRNGYIKTEQEKEELLNDIATKKPDVVFVAMGSPKQELLMMEMQQRHEAIYQGLGGSFDVYTGNVKRAPKWWIEHDLEFAYRLVKQPSRIKRQLFLVKFLIYLKLGKI